MTDGVNVRELALDILLDVTKNGAYSHLALADVLEKYQYLDKKERAFLTRLTEGTLERMIQLDYIIGCFSAVPVRKMKPAIRCILQSGVYQICFMDAVPDAAACNEAVKLAKKRGFSRLGGFVNGVLRSVSRGKGAVAYPDKHTQTEDWLSVMYSVPRWMIRLWKRDFGWDWDNPDDLVSAEAMLRAYQEPAPLTIRTNTERISPEGLKARLEQEGVAAVPSGRLPYAFYIAGYDHLAKLQSFQDGLFYVQDLSAMLAAETAAPEDGDFIVDVCAAPGGKAIHLAQLMHGTGHVLARDLTEYKLALLEENIARCHVGNVETQIWDATAPDASLEKKADIVMADLPCSGLGVLRRKKDIRYKMTEEKAKELAALQRKILSVVSGYVKPGGKLVYSTCTVNRMENEENAAWFAAQFPQFLLKSSRSILPGGEGGDGFYIALFERVADRS